MKINIKGKHTGFYTDLYYEDGRVLDGCYALLSFKKCNNESPELTVKLTAYEGTVEDVKELEDLIDV